MLRIAIQSKIKFVSEKFPEVIAYFRPLKNSEKTEFLAAHIEDIEAIEKSETKAEKALANMKAVVWQNELLSMLLVDVDGIVLSVDGKDKKINWKNKEQREQIIEHINGELFSELAGFALSLMSLSESAKNE